MGSAMKDSGVEWIGEIPEAWAVKRLASCFTECRTKNDNYVMTTALQFKMGKIIRKPIRGSAEENKETYSAYTIVSPGVIMINGLNLEFDFITQRVGLVEENGIITSAYIALSPSDNVDAQYMCYLLKSYDSCKAFHAMGRGLRKILNYNELKTKPIIVPSIYEQHRISVCLDEKCVEIDTILDQTRASIEEYKRLKQAVITRAVTKGVRGDRPMKESGITLIGQIPNDWETIRLKYLMSIIVDCPHETPNYCTDGPYYVVRTADEDLGFLRSDENMYRLDEAEYKNRTRRLTLDKDDIVYGREGERWGLACLIPVSGKYCLGQRMMQFRSNRYLANPEFMMYALNSRNVYLQGAFDTIGSTSPHVNISTIINYAIPTPPMDEQLEIAGYLGKKCGEIDALVAKKEQLLSELENYKKALIYEYVTGKKTVSEQ